MSLTLIRKMSSTLDRSAGLSLNLDLPGSTEQVDVVDEITTERSLQRLEDVTQFDTEDLHLVPIDIEINGRVRGGKGTEDVVELRILVCRDRQAAQDLRKLLRVRASQILEHIGEAAAASETKDRRERNRHHRAPLHGPELRIQPRDHLAHPERWILPFLERLECDDHGTPHSIANSCR